MQIKYAVCAFAAYALIFVLSFNVPVNAAQPSLRDTYTNGVLSSKEDIGLWTSDGYNYYFTYCGEEFYAVYYGDTWKIYDSYRIVNANDIEIICSALSDAHPVPGKDYYSYRTPSDMAFEWIQHNIAYHELPEGNSWRYHAGNVDIDPQDQGKSFQEIYEDRTGRKMDILFIRDKIMEIIERYLH